MTPTLIAALLVAAVVWVIWAIRESRKDWRDWQATGYRYTQPGPYEFEKAVAGRKRARLRELQRRKVEASRVPKQPKRRPANVADIRTGKRPA